MNKDYFEKAFAYFDINHDGTISYEEVVSFLGNSEE
jgi:Ca2+-binding EF-hand superfamily protein